MKKISKINHHVRSRILYRASDCVNDYLFGVQGGATVRITVRGHIWDHVLDRVWFCILRVAETIETKIDA